MPDLDFSKPLLMGIVNITSDSFSDGGDFLNIENAVRRIKEIKNEGADIIDIGAQSTAGSKAIVTADEEWQRLEQVLKKIDFSSTFVSVDTFRAQIAEKALRLGVQMINDVTGLREDRDMLEVLLQYRPYICLMHSSYDTPFAGNEEKHFEDIMFTMRTFLFSQSQKLISAGFPKEKIIIDPGMGRFLSNDPSVSFEVIDRLSELKALGFPILIGHSRKGFLGGPMNGRDQRTFELSKKCLQNGANILRVHDVKKHRLMVS